MYLFRATQQRTRSVQTDLPGQCLETFWVVTTEWTVLLTWEQMGWNSRTLLDILQCTGHPLLPTEITQADVGCGKGKESCPKPFAHNHGFEHLLRGCVT